MRALPVLLATVAGAIAAAPPPSAVLPDGTYTYEMRVGGSAIGSSTIVVRRDGGTIEVAESASMSGATLVSERSIREATFATSTYSVDTRGTHAAIAFAGNVATVTQNGASATIAAPPGAPFVVNDNMVAGFAQIPATLRLSGAKRLTLACACGSFEAIPVALVAQQPGLLTISMQGATATLQFDEQSGVLQRFDFPSQQFSIVLLSHQSAIVALPSPVVPTPVPLPSPHYASRDVTIAADDGVSLAGTLTLPDAPAAPAPGFVFIHGSGCNDRDEKIGPNKIFAQLANTLSNDGYAVLRYDKRSCGKSGGTFPVRDRLVADALDAVAYLRMQPGIDQARIFVLGHSEGGELAPSVAIADGHLRGIVLLAPPAIPLERVLMQQALRNAIGAQRSGVAAKELAEIAAIAAGKRPGAGNAWLRSSFGIDPAALIAAVPCPILIVQGGKDIQVLAADTPRLVEAARAANRHVTTVMLADDDHLFIKLPAGQLSTGAEYFAPSYLDPALFAAIENWLSGLRSSQLP